MLKQETLYHRPLSHLHPQAMHFNISSDLIQESSLMNLPSLEKNMCDNLLEFFKKPLTEIEFSHQKSLALGAKLWGNSLQDTLYHLPTQAIERSFLTHLDLNKHIGTTIAFEGTVLRHLWSSKPNAPHRIIIQTMGKDGHLEIALVYFKMHPENLRSMFPIKAKKIISGKLESFDIRLQIVHPDYVVAADKHHSIPTIQPLYGLTAGLTQQMAGKIIRHVAEQIPQNIPEWIRPDMMQKQKWVSLPQSLRSIHCPAQTSDCMPQSPYARRIAYDMIFSHQVRLAQIRHSRQVFPARPFSDTRLYHRMIQQLPFTLTADQEHVLQDVIRDLGQGDAMARLIQGDVGSGKTVVALLASMLVIARKAQAALMVPTEILAKQHYQSMLPLCEAIGVRVVLLTGKDKTKATTETLRQIATGEADLIIGTHALIQEKVIYHNLALGIIDEQHRFGVNQRHLLSCKGHPYAHILLLTATPIPRSLAMAHYGDVDFSRMGQKPAGRKPIKTTVMPVQKMESLLSGLDRIIAQGQRIYWVCPLVEESEKMDLMAVQQRFAMLEQIFKGKIGLVHGKMKTADKDAVIADFVSGKIQMLVATTVIEVGVNVPEATVIVIEEAERFGLSQLHQLRGRVGRGNIESSCVLLYKKQLSETATQRLKILRETEDGFVLSEKDLELRGAGDLLGTAQTGTLSLKGFHYDYHSDLIALAREDARYFLEHDYGKNTPREGAVSLLLRFVYGENDLLLV